MLGGQAGGRSIQVSTARALHAFAQRNWNITHNAQELSVSLNSGTEIAAISPCNKSVTQHVTNMTTSFRVKVILASVANLLVLSYIHYLTRAQFVFFVFYFIPVSLCGWYLGRLSVFCMAVFTGISWCFVDSLSEHQYAHEAIRYGNSLICFLAFASIGVLVQGLRHSLSEQQTAREAMQKAHDELKKSTEEVTKLQGQLQVVCAWTQRINVEGKWITLDEFLKDKLKARISYGVSPEAMQDVLQAAGAPATVA